MILQTDLFSAVVFCSENWKENMYTLLMTVFFYACESPDKNILDTATVEDEPLNCPTGVYPALLQVWNGEEQDNLVDTPPFCEDLFDIELQNEGVLYSAGDCEFERGEQTRILSYVFQGELDESGQYAGEVSLVKQNGTEDLASFSGSCTQTESTVQIRIDWSMTVTTPNGERLHVGIIETEE